MTTNHLQFKTIFATVGIKEVRMCFQLRAPYSHTPNMTHGPTIYFK